MGYGVVKLEWLKGSMSDVVENYCKQNNLNFGYNLQRLTINGIIALIEPIRNTNQILLVY